MALAKVAAAMGTRAAKALPLALAAALATAKRRSKWPGIPRGLGNEDGSAEAQVQSTAAEVARILRPGMAPVAKSHRELPAEDDDDRHLPGH